MQIHEQRMVKVQYITAHLKGVHTTQFKRSEDESGEASWDKLSYEGNWAHWSPVSVKNFKKLNQMYKERYGGQQNVSNQR